MHSWRLACVAFLFPGVPLQDESMKQPLLFLDQTGSWGGAQRVLEGVLGALEREFLPLVALLEGGSFAGELRTRGIDTLTFRVGLYLSGRKSFADTMAFPI